MGPAFAVRIQNAIAVDHFVIFVFEKWKIELTVETLTEYLGKVLRFLVLVDADGEDLYFVFLDLRQKTFQLPELFDAIGSPMSPVENYHDGFLAAKIR